MRSVRLLLLRHTRLTGILVLVALCMKLLVPSGFMPMLMDGRITIQLCPGKAPAAASTMMPGMSMADHGGGHDKAPSPRENPEMPCAFAGLATPLTGAVDPVVLAVAIATMLALAFRLPVRLPTTAAPRLRPPSRAPPALA